ncbi:MAG TPA: hypothetical protein VNT99_18145, partial [Methylomirabilota bacterium]|nr:hypothetical protein [Methylomirabilota bacterium]
FNNEPPMDICGTRAFSGLTRRSDERAGAVLVIPRRMRVPHEPASVPPLGGMRRRDCQHTLGNTIENDLDGSVVSATARAGEGRAEHDLGMCRKSALLSICNVAKPKITRYGVNALRHQKSGLRPITNATRQVNRCHYLTIDATIQPNEGAVTIENRLSPKVTIAGVTRLFASFKNYITICPWS